MANRAVWHWLLTAAPLLLLVAGVFCALGGEDAVAAYFREHRAAHPDLTACMRLVSDWAVPAFYPAYAWQLFRGVRDRDKRRLRLALGYAVAQILVSLLIVRALKIGIGRPRPDADGLFSPMSLDPGHHSLPSGHTTEATTAALPFALGLRRAALSLRLGLVVALVGASRIYLGWHHPSDLLAGLAVGSLAGLLVHRFAVRAEP
jgi:undecaprenyl-diphosphatase